MTVLDKILNKHNIESFSIEDKIADIRNNAKIQFGIHRFIKDELEWLNTFIKHTPNDNIKARLLTLYTTILRATDYIDTLNNEIKEESKLLLDITSDFKFDLFLDSEYCE